MTRRLAMAGNTSEMGADHMANLATSSSNLIAQLCELTKRWTTFEDIPKSQQHECREIGRRLEAIGGMDLMQTAYYEAKGRNRSASTIQAYWDGIGEWRW